MALRLEAVATALKAGPPVLRADDFEGCADGKPTHLYTLRNARGMTVRFTNLGAKIQQIVVPDRHGAMDDVALGYDSIGAVMEGVPSMGAFIGRYANRIAGGRFTLDGREWSLEPNHRGNSLHGGARGSCARVFDVAQLDAATAQLTLYYEEEHDGFPGNLMSRVVYHVSDHNELSIEYDAVCDRPGVVNMTSHVFFNLAGHARVDPQSLAEHLLTLNASAYTPVDATQVPTGTLLPVAGTPMDFTRPQRIGERLDQPFAQFEPGGGYDHNWALDKPPGEFGLAARVEEPLSGRVMEVYSTEPGIVFYGGNNLTGEGPRHIGKQGVRYARRSGLCLEPAHYPDSPNHPQFPGTVIRPGQWFSGRTVYAFSTSR